MQVIQSWSRQSDSLFGSRRVWAFDLDDTLTSRGTIPATVLMMLEKLQSQGHFVVMVTGRPSAWAQPFAKTLPFDAVIAENGASMCFWKHGKDSRVLGEEPESLYWTSSGYVEHQDLTKSQDGELRKKNMKLVQEAVFKDFPKMKIASDQTFRLYDLAIDFGEAVQPARPLTEAESVKKIFEIYGAVAKVSSIHVNGWWGDFDKSLGLKTLFKNVSWNLSFDSVVYFGDSPNDAPLFRMAPMSIGVSNLNRFDEDKSWVRPTFIASKESSEGVLEALNHYLNIAAEGVL